MLRDSNPRRLPARTRASDRSLHGEEAPARRRGGNLFAWTIIILLLIAFAIACWIFSFYVFGHPENAFSYSVLTKLKKLEAPKRFELTSAPRGDFLNAAQLWERYNQMSNRELSRANEALLRNYLRNYKLTQDHVPYVVGNYKILDSYELTNKNFFPSGVVAIAQSADLPYVLLEQIFTAESRVVPILQRMLLTGLDLRLDRTVDLSALINVRRLEDGRLQFTAIPLLYGSYAASTGPGTFSLTPPLQLNAAAGLPVLDNETISGADKKFATHRQRAGLNPAGGETAPKLQTRLMRVERPQPANGGTPPPLPESTPAALPAVAENPEPAPDASASPEPTTPPPFGAASPGSIATTAGGSWPVYAPSQMPRGRLLNVPDMQHLVGQGVAGERIYLQGNFVVTASGQNRAVLRAQSALGENLGVGGRTSGTRVIVEFPSTDHPPSEGSTFSRDSRRPFLITDVRKGADGQVNVYVREVTHPQ
jgi:hypothetical protein